jgi:hypothetical protein
MNAEFFATPRETEVHMVDRFQGGQRVRSRKTGEVGTVVVRETPPPGVQPITGVESYTVERDGGQKEPMVHPDELEDFTGKSAAAGQKNEPEGHYRTIDGNKFWCEPKKSSGIQDPTRRTYTDPDGNEYWCIPEDEIPTGRRYTSEGPKPPYPQSGD